MGNVRTDAVLNLSFTADTKQAQKSLEDLSKQFNKLFTVNARNSGLGLDKELIKANNAALELKRHISEAINVDTGQLDVGKLTKSFQQSQKSLNDYRQSLVALGPEGEKTFKELSQAILNADVPLRESNKLLQNFATTLKNTAKWQISSSLLHGFMGSISQAYHYAQDLNESLNNIRIVTGQNVDEMAKFAKEANAAAQALNTTTTAYTNASLIYYQQGLSTEEVRERTDVTVKMANVTREAASDVSQQLTAVWNNFAKAGDNLEYYADVMTALGAATASSSAEISEGLEKFAAVADTVGLSYEYATAALATVTATTRQSADVVGNAFKTLFARLEGLKLGETLEDGTDLNKYSEALYKVGIDIKDVNGEMKDMDDLLDEMGAKWTTLGKDQQLALAQTVAGVRQYTQLVALMDNWDFFESNVDIAKSAEGTLQKQADIYGESWEAASKRVTAALQEIYDKILDDKFFIDLADGFSNLINVLSNFIDKIGGIKGVLSGLGILITNLYGKSIASSIDGFFTTSIARTNLWKKTQLEALAALEELESEVGESAYKYETITKAVEDLTNAEHNLTEEQKKQAKSELDMMKNMAAAMSTREKNIKSLKSEIATLKDKVKAEEESLKNQANNITGSARKHGISKTDLFSAEPLSKEAKERIIASYTKDKTGNDLETSKEGAARLIAEIEAYKKAKQELAVEDEKLIKLEEELNVTEEEQADAMRSLNNAGEEFADNLEKTEPRIVSFGQTIVGFAQALSSISMAIASLQNLKDIWDDEDTSTLDKLLSTLTTLSMVLPMLITGVKALKTSVMDLPAAFTSLAATMSGLTVAEVTTTGTTVVLGDTLKALVGSILGVEASAATVALTLGGVGVALVALTAIIWGCVEAYKDFQAQSIDGQLKAAEANVQKLNDEYRELKGNVESLVESFDKYNSITEKLESCTKGTQEWRDALQEVNDQVLEIIKANPTLEVHYDEYGQAKINQEDIDNVLNTAKQGALNAQAAVLSNEADISRLTAEKQLNDLLYSSYDSLSSYLQNSQSAYEHYEDAFRGVSYIKDNYKELAGLTEKEYKDKLKELNIHNDVIDELSQYQNNIDELVKNEEIAAKKAESVGINLAYQTLDVDKYSKEAIEMAGRSYYNTFTDIEKEIKEQNKRISRTDSASNEDVKDIWSRYNKAIGREFNEYNLAENAVRKGDSEREFWYLDEQKEEQKVTIDEIASTIAAAEAMEKFGTAADDATKVLSKLSTATPTDSKAITDFISNRSFNELSSKEINELNYKINGDAFNYNNKDYVAEYLHSIFGEDQDLEELARSWGYNSYEDLKEGFKLGLKESAGAVDDLKSSMNKVVLQSFSDLEDSDVLNKASINTQQIIGKILTTAFRNGGEEQLKVVEDFINVLPQDQINSFADVLNSIDDWNNVSLEDFKQSLKDAGVEIETDDASLSLLIEALQKFSLVSDQAVEIYTKFHEVIDKLKNGATITQEQLDSLGSEYEQYFLRMADGTYKLITDAQTFYDVVNKRSVKDIKENVEVIRDIKSNYGNDYEGLKSYSRESQTKEKTNTQFDLLSFMGYDEDKINKWKDNLANFEPYTVTAINTYREMATAISENADAYGTLDDVLERNYEYLASTATNLDELHTMLDEGAISIDAFTKAAMAMDAETDTKNLDADELKEFSEYLQHLSEEEIQATKGLQNLNKNMTDKQATIVAKGIMKMNKAIDTLSKNWENWSDILKKSSSDSEEYADAMKGTTEAVAELLDVNQNFIKADFISQHLDEITKAAEGSEEAIDSLKESLKEGLIAEFKIRRPENFQELWGQEFATYQNWLDNQNLEIGADFNDSRVISKFNELVSSANMTVDEVNAMFDSMGYEATFSSEPVETMVRVPQYEVRREPVGDDPNHYIESSTLIGYEEYPGIVDVTAMAVNGKAPKITKLTKKASGSANNDSSINTGGKKKGGSSGKSDKKEFKAEIDRYWDLDNAIKATANDLDKLNEKMSKAAVMKDHLAGGKLIKAIKDENTNINKQIKLLDDQTKNYKAKLKEQKQELKEVTGIGKAKVNYLIGTNPDADLSKLTLSDFGAAVNKNGKLKEGEYDRLLRENAKAMTKATKAYNKSEQTELDKETYEYAQKRYETLEALLEKYRQLYYDDIRSTEADIAKAEQEELEKKLKKAANNIETREIKLQVKLDAHETKRNFLDFRKQIETDFRKSFSDLTIDAKVGKQTVKTYKQDFNAILKDVNAYSKELERMNKENYKAKDIGKFGTKADTKKLLQEAYNSLIEKAGDAQSAAAALWDTYISGIDQTQQKFSDLNNEYDRMTSKLDHQKKLIELLYGDKAYSKMDKYYKGQEQITKNKIVSLQKEVKTWSDIYEARLKEHEAEGVNRDDITTWTEDVRKAYDNMIDAQSSLNTEVEDMIQLFKDDLLNAVDIVTDKLNKDLFGTTLDKAKEDWDFKQNNVAGEYNDDYQRGYKVQSLANKIDKGIAEATSLKAQEKLQKLRDEEIKTLREKETLTQDDLDLAEARYQLALKEIALEDAQNQKNSMKLTRNAEGNWSYQYVADEDKLADKQQDLLDAGANLYEIAIKAEAHAGELYLNLVAEFEEKIKDAIANNATQEDLKKIAEQYEPLIKYAADNQAEYRRESIAAGAKILGDVAKQDAEYTKTLSENQNDVIDKSVKYQLDDYEKLREAIYTGNEALYPGIRAAAEQAFNETNVNSSTVAGQMIDTWSADNGTSVKAKLQEAFVAIQQEVSTFKGNIEDLNTTVDGEFDDITGNIDEATSGVNSLNTAISNLAKDAPGNIDKLKNKFNETKDIVNDLLSKIDSLEEKMSGLGVQTVGDIDNPLGGDDSVGNGESGDAGGGAPTEDADEAQSSLADVVAGHILYYEGQPTAAVQRWGAMLEQVFKKKKAKKKRANIIKKLQNVMSGKATLKKSKEDYEQYDIETVRAMLQEDPKTKFDTGGYTGSWDSSGRLAVLHQKELVLNSDDTANMLQAVTAIRDLTKLNDSIDSAIAASIGQMALSLVANNGSNIRSASGNSNTNNTFNITAEFPNASDVESIREAILSLPNLASQFKGQRMM